MGCCIAAFRCFGRHYIPSAETGKQGIPFVPHLPSLSRSAAGVVKWEAMIVFKLLGQAFFGIRMAVSEFYFQWGMFYARWGHPTRAFWYFNRAVTMNRGGFKAYYNRGLLFMAVGMPERALGDFSMAIRNDPTHVDARVTRSVVYTLTGRHEEALDDLEQAVEMGADRDDLEYQLSVARTRMGT